MNIEPNVHLERASAQIFYAMMQFGEVVKDVTPATGTITSVGDGKHSRADSRHYPNAEDLVDAADGRIKDMDGNIMDLSEIDRWMGELVVKALAKRLGPQYTVILENNHIHMQFNRRPNRFVNGKYVD